MSEPALFLPMWTSPIEFILTYCDHICMLTYLLLHKLQSICKDVVTVSASKIRNWHFPHIFSVFEPTIVSEYAFTSRKLPAFGKFLFVFSFVVYHQIGAYRVSCLQISDGLLRSLFWWPLGAYNIRVWVLTLEKFFWQNSSLMGSNSDCTLQLYHWATPLSL